MASARGAGRGGGNVGADKVGSKGSWQELSMAVAGAGIAAALASLQNAEFAYKVKLKMPVGMEKKTPKPKL